MLINNKTETSQMMLQVICALSIGIIAMAYFFGFSVLIQIVLAIITALTVEALFLKLRDKDVIFAIKDYSAIVTAILLAISIPSVAPWWIIVLGTTFAIIFGKQLYGGLGHNPFNPAMLGYVFLLLSYPLQMTQWQNVQFLDIYQSFSLIFELDSIDSYTAATLLDSLKTKIKLTNSIKGLEYYSLPALAINICFLIGGIWLIFRNIIDYHISFSILITIFILSTIFHTLNQDIYLSPLTQLFSGATILAAFFIATDPVTASTTKNGRIIYGVLIGFLIYIIRTFGGYPDAVAFAVLLANISVPLIDYYTKPKIFGDK